MVIQWHAWGSVDRCEVRASPIYENTEKAGQGHFDQREVAALVNHLLWKCVGVCVCHIKEYRKRYAYFNTYITILLYSETDWMMAR
jgi:hypothetical protein